MNLDFLVNLSITIGLMKLSMNAIIKEVKIKYTLKGHCRSHKVTFVKNLLFLRHILIFLQKFDIIETYRY